MKTCVKCGEARTPTDFYRDDKSCKPCRRAYARARQRINDSVREYDRARAKLPHRKANSRRTVVHWRAENPEAYRAQTAVSNAVRDGKLDKEPCLFCGNEKVHAHHRDYSKPLEVKWLCAKCHHRLHANFPETEGHGATV